MTMTKIWMLTNERNLITKRENDWAKRNAKQLNENEKEQVPCELLVASASSNWSDQSSVKLQSRTKCRSMPITLHDDDENGRWRKLWDNRWRDEKSDKNKATIVNMTMTKTQHSDDDENLLFIVKLTMTMTKIRNFNQLDDDDD